MIKYRFLTPAEDEITEAALFYDDAAVGLGSDFLIDLQRCINYLRRYPKAGTPITADLRRMPLHRFPFNIIYSEQPSSILIVSVAHHSKRPDYWRSRIL